MIKFLLLLLIPLFTAPVTIKNNNVNNGGSFSSSSLKTIKKENEQPSYPYVEGIDGHGAIVRTYATSAFAPTLVKTFKAPSGFSVRLQMDEDRLDILMNELDSINPNYQRAVMPAYYYRIAGSSVFVDGDYYTSSDPDRRTQIKDQFRDSLNNLVLFSADELTNPTELGLELRISVASQDDNTYIFVLNSDLYTYEPYGEYDFVNISADYYQAEGGADVRVTLRGSPMDGLLYDGVSGNADGFHLDDDYEITIMSNGLPLGIRDIQMTFPASPVYINARLQFNSGGIPYTFYSKTLQVVNPNIDILVDGYSDRSEIQKGSDHLFSVHLDYFDLNEMGSAYISAYLYPYHLNDDDIVVIKNFDTPGKEGQVYYLPSDEEIAANKINDDINEPAYGSYYVWSKEAWQDEYTYNTYDFQLFSNNYICYEDDEDYYDGDVNDLFSALKSVPFMGRWSVYYRAFFGQDNNSFFLETIEDKFIDVVAASPTKDEIILTVDNNVVEESINLVAGTGAFDIVPTVQTERTEEVKYYYDYEVSKEGVIEITEKEDGVLTINPISHGVVTLTFYVECRLYFPISKTITIRVIDTVLDVSKVEVPDEFHYAGKDLTASVSVRGFKNILNLPIEWTVTNKAGDTLTEEKYVVRKDATLVIPKAESDDYTIKACYEGIELDTITVQVRYINLNQFLRVNIWWIFLLTLIFVAAVIFLNVINKRSKTTVEHIERVYQVYYQCMSDDKLSKEELVRIKKEITKCLHRCEDLNIDALNQYEKATRYLRKSLFDVKTLIDNYDTTSPADRGVYTDRLDKDLSKALNVAKEIENAKGLIENYHNKANRQNYEVLKEDGQKDDRNN